jgi:hypothetical protein
VRFALVDQSKLLSRRRIGAASSDRAILVATLRLSQETKRMLAYGRVMFMSEGPSELG